MMKHLLLLILLAAAPFTDEADISIDLKSGTLTLRGGANELVEASGDIRIRTKSHHRAQVIGEGEVEVSIHPTVPVNLDVEMDKGTANLDVSHINLTTLNVDGGELNTGIKPMGDQPQLEKIEIDQEGGAIVLNMAGAYPKLKQLDVDGGDAGVFVEALGDFAKLEEVEVEGGSGNIYGHFTGRFDRLEELDITATQGRVQLNLDGTFARSAKIEVHTTSGDCHVILPPDVGVAVTTSTAEGHVKLEGLQLHQTLSDQEVHVTPGFKEGSLVLHVDVTTTTGNIHLEVL